MLCVAIAGGIGWMSLHQKRSLVVIVMNEPRSTNPSLVPVESEPAPHIKFPLLDTDSVGLLARLERQLSSGKTPVSTKALALATIKAQGLTRLHGLTFQAYCDQRLRLKKSRVHQLLGFAELLAGTTKSGTHPSADNERQLRPLRKLPREDWSDAWAEAVRTASAGKLSGRHIQGVVDARLAKIQAAQVPAPAPATDHPPAQAAMPTVVADMVDTILPATSTTPAPQPCATGCIPTVPDAGIKLPGWKPAWQEIIRAAPRPPSSLSAGIFGWQAPD